MATPVEILFVGLCSLLNMTGQAPNVAGPAVVVYDDKPTHTPFIGFDATQLSISGATATPINGTKLAFIELSGEDLTIQSDPPGNPVIGANMDKLAHLTKYGDITNPAWVRSRIPDKGGKPTKAAAAAFIPLGSGTLTAGRISPITWTFKDSKGKPSPTQPSLAFAREIKYSFDSSTGTLVLEAGILGSSNPLKTITFTPTNAGPIRIWIGNAVKGSIANEIDWKEPSMYMPGGHFKNFYASVSNPGHIYIPYPDSKAMAPTRPKKGHGHVMDFGTGFCGPDLQP